MCLIAVAWQEHPQLRLVVAANRDEFHDRPAAPLALWPEPPPVIAGRDLRAGGTWLAVGQGGRFAAVTNVREAQLEAAAHSRGDLVSGFVQGEHSAVDYARRLEPRASGYGPFNLILCDAEELIYLSNRPQVAWRRLSAGIHGFSNGPLEPLWPKARFLNAALQEWLISPAAREHSGHGAALFTALARAEPFPDAELPDTGFGIIATERRLSSPFISGEIYGTRCSTVLWWDQQGRGEIIERRFAPSGHPDGETRLALPPARA